jgi:hypothetical protein
MVSLSEDGLLKVKAGVTTPDELLRVVTEVRESRSLCPSCGISVAPRLRRLPGVRSPRRRRLPALPAADPVRLEVLPLLREEHRSRGSAQGRAQAVEAA